MVQTHQKYGDKGLQIIGISLDQNKGALDNVVKAQGFAWPQHFDGRGWNNKFAQEWGVRSIPATFLLSPEGKVLWKGHPAQMDKPIENAFRTSPPVLVDPETVALAGTALDQAETALAGGDTGAALKALATLPADARQDAGVNERAEKALEQLQPAVDAAMADAEAMVDQKQFAEAAARFADLSKGLVGTPAGTKARARLDELSRRPEVKAHLAAEQASARAAEELAAAKRLQSEGQDEQAYAKFKSIARSGPDTEAGRAAAEAAAHYEQDPAFVKRANESAAAGKAKGMMSIAASYRSSGKPELAKKKYQEVIDQFPGTSYAEAAEKEIVAIR